MAREREKVLRVARFDYATKHYLLAYGVLICIMCIITIPLAPLYYLFGMPLVDKWMARLECRLTDRSIYFRKGLMNRIERTVPLDMVTDVALKQGPLMRMFGIEALAVETAGQSGAGTAVIQILGVVGASEFREAVLEQRDELVESRAGRRGGSSGAAPSVETTGAPSPAPIGGADATMLLTEIRDSLGRIETKLVERGA
ncbi:MAG: PH domain-containing protein [Phycisphaeraceae bacterium]|nr:MAG: PH domain-containing protein [Phycisphaeraceae bacterium]